jgi:hypothetical protein
VATRHVLKRESLATIAPVVTFTCAKQLDVMLMEGDDRERERSKPSMR